MDIIDISSLDPKFCPSEWIGCGKEYPHENTPLFIADAHAKAFNLSTDMQKKHLHDGTMPVCEFVTKILPQQSNTFKLIKPERWFSPNEPNSDLHVLTLATESIPSTEILDRLWKASKEMWFQGMKSITNPCGNQYEYLPLEALGMWKELEDIVSAQYSWKGSQGWLTAHLPMIANDFRGYSGALLAEKTKDFLDRIAWNREILKDGRPFLVTRELTRVLGSGSDPSNYGWLSDSVMDLLVESLRSRMMDLSRDSKVIIAPLVMGLEIKRGRRSRDYSSTKLLQRYKYRVEQGQCNEIYVPVLVNGCHWIVFHIDFHGKFIEYGDSQQQGVGKKMYQELSWFQEWILASFNRRFEIRGGTMEIGNQTDMSSCGLFAINAIEHAVFGEALYQQSDIPSYRAWWFVKCIDEFASDLLSAPRSKATSRRRSWSDLFGLGSTKLKSVTTSLRSKKGGVSDRESTDGSFKQRSRSPQAPTDSKSSPILTQSDSSFSIPQDFLPSVESLTRDSTTSPLPDASSIMSLPETESEGRTSSLGDISMVLPSESASMDDGNSLVSEDIGLDICDKVDQGVDIEEEAVEKNPRARSGLLGWLGISKRPATNSVSVDQSDGKDKRKRDSDGDLDEPKTKKKAPGKPLGTSRAAVRARNARQAVKAGTFVLNHRSDRTWRAKCLALDPEAKFIGDTADRVRCSRCHQVVAVKQSYDSTRFREHVDECETKRMKSINNQLKSTPSTSSVKMQIVQRKCPGLTDKWDKCIGPYLQRPGADGGGGRTLDDVALRFFSKKYNKLSKKDKAEVLKLQEEEFRWYLERKEGIVRASDCKKLVDVKGNEAPQPCGCCMGLLLIPAFGSALNKPLPKAENFKYTNSRYRDDTLLALYAKINGLQDLLDAAEAGDPFTRFTQGVASGRYTDEKLLSGLIQTIILRNERQIKGTGMQNFSYPPEWDQFLHVISIESPLAYRTLLQYLPGRTERSFRHLRAKMPTFPMVVGPETFTQVSQILGQLNYTGPIALSCDDTKLLESLRLCWDHKEKTHLLVGSVHGPIQVANPDEMHDVLTEHTPLRGTKVRLFVAQVPLPGVSPILIAALPILESNNAEDLVKYSARIIEGLLALGIKIVSYSSDGTEVERKVGRLLLKMYESRKHTIPCPNLGGYDLDVYICLINGYPILILQDSKHALKTFRNNLFSGARLLAFGNFVSLFRHVFEIAFASDSPLYHRDVEKVDKQDDNAACRLFSSATLDWVITNHPERLGLIFYLFVFGELIDAYQNRAMAHIERIRIALRAYYFVKMWRSFLLKAKYSTDRYFISREAFDITMILVEGLIGLILVHRDYYHTPEAPVPLFPWFHSTEPCKHCFGSTRKLVKDFTLLDFYRIIQKLRIRIHQTHQLGRASDSRPAAQGYNHTYVDHRGVDFPKLASYPTDDEISIIAREAMEEAESLVNTLGVAPHYLIPYASTDNPFESFEIPEADEDVIEDNVSQEHEDNATRTLHTLTQSLADEDWTGSTMRFDTELTNIASAAAALSINDMMTVNALPEIDLEMEHALVSTEQQNINTALAQAASIHATTITSPSCGVPFLETPSAELDLTTLVRIRQSHETKQAIEGVRTRGSPSDLPPSEEGHSGAHPSRELVKRLHNILREHSQHKGVGTGLERHARWFEDADISEKATRGNAHNASFVASDVAKKAIARRASLLSAAHVPEAALIETARITQLRPLKIGDFGIVFDGKAVTIGKVIALYVPSSGRHGSTDSTVTIGALSYIDLELWEQRHRNEFRRKMGLLRTQQFVHIPVLLFLSVVSKPQQGKIPDEVRISEEDLRLYQSLDKATSQIVEMDKLSRKRQKNSDGKGKRKETGAKRGNSKGKEKMLE